MKVIIIGAGEVGRGIASILCGEGHEVVVVDNSPKLLKRVRESLDVVSYLGSGVSSETLKKLAPADLLVAATGEDTTNILCCQLAAPLGIQRTICRLSSDEYFRHIPNFLPALLGITQTIVPSLECVDKIVHTIEHRLILEKTCFKELGAEITSLKLPTTSPLIGVRLRDFPEADIIGKVRFCGIIRNGKFIVPRGETVFATGDEVFISGLSEDVMKLIVWISGEEPVKTGERVIIGGGSTFLAKRLAERVLDAGYDVRVIEENREKCDEILDELGRGLMVINGDPTERDILEEAGVSDAPCFISVMEDDEDNILSCMLAKKKGAKKTISIVNKYDYQVLFSSLNMIDCFFSPSAVGVNSALKFIEEERTRVIALIHRANLFVFELIVEAGASFCGKRISECGSTPEMIFAFVNRNGKMLSATGDLVLQENDKVTMISDFDTIKQIQQYFSKSA